jgi:hypothetical protein
MVHLASLAVGVAASGVTYYTTSRHLVQGRNKAIRAVGGTDYEPAHHYGAQYVSVPLCSFTCNAASSGSCVSRALNNIAQIQ